MKAWEKELEILRSGIPCYQENDNEALWEEQATGPEIAQDAQTKIYWRSQVPGSRAVESICLATIQAMENRGYKVPGAMDIIEEGFKTYEAGDMPKLHKLTQRAFRAAYAAEKDESSPYWNQTFYDTFEDYAAAVNFPEKTDVPIDDTYLEKTYSGWLSQIIGGAYGTCIEGYTGERIKERYGEVDRYIRKPNTYNDDITFEIALLLAYEQYGKETSSVEIGEEWIARIPTAWSAEDFALRNMRAGIMPPESGLFHNPFNEWIGAQMRGAICGQLFPGDLKKAAECAYKDAVISHARNGVLGEVFNALMVSMAYYENDIRKILETCINLIPADSEYGQVIRFAYEQCKTHEDYYSAWMVCENQYQKYNWVHAYPNACAEIVSLYFGEGDFNKTIAACGGCGQDVDCNAAQIMTIIGTIIGSEAIPEYWKKPIGDELDTYVRDLKKISIHELAEKTAKVAASLK